MNTATKEHKLVLAWQKLMSNKKNIVKKCMPVLLAVVLLLAVGFFAFGPSNAAGWLSLDVFHQELDAEKQALEQSKQELEQTLADTKAMLDKLAAENQTMQALLDQIAQEKGEIYDAIGDMKDTYDQIEQDTLQKWIVPIDYLNVSSRFGYRRQPTGGASTFHSGVDLAAPAGTPVVASRAGTVTIATYDEYSGYYVTINHHDGYTTSYLHLQRYIVKPGQVVIAGQVIGYCGSSGVSTGAHLHFGVSYKGEAVNPGQFIDI